ncbi:MAG: nuclear transport factor 2 family protein [Microthrixaceae bacterium]|nr:nuclear transport factor 2 family protein [Acidimicrobiales bacterium]MCB9403763.1 nuclear transport factor 2 family protein [Microthrixaceae bacterium]
MTSDDLAEIHRIHQLKYRYLRYLDLKEWDELGGCFVAEATASYASAPELDGREAIIGFLRDAMSSTTLLTSHKVHHPEITLLESERASGIWALDDRVLVLDAGIEIAGAAFYQDEYVRTSDGWLISHTGYRRVFEEVRPLPQDSRITLSWWSEGGMGDQSHK